MNKAELPEAVAAADGKFEQNSEMLAVIRDVQSKKKRRRKNDRQERMLDSHDVDEIYALVQSLRNEGGEGQELLERFLESRTGTPIIAPSAPTKSVPPIKSITIVKERPGGNSKSRVRAT